MFILPSRLYPITDTQLSGLSHAAQVAELTKGGARLIQLREKHLGPSEFCREAEAAVRLGQARGARIIINDHVDIALALGADGVHLGQEDLSPEAARRLLGDDAIIGISTHTAEQAQRAVTLPVAYIAIGPIFATSTKLKPEPVVGLDGLRRVRDVTNSIPLVAIGGITAENASAVIAAGADAVALIGALLIAPAAIQDRTRKFLSLL